MRFVDDNGKGATCLHGDFVENEGELLHRGDNDLLSLLNEAAEVTGLPGMAYRSTNLHKLANGFLELIIENPAVGNHNHGVEQLPSLPLQVDKLVRKPGNGV